MRTPSGTTLTWEDGASRIRPPSDSKSPRPVSRRGLNYFCDDDVMPVICPTFQTLKLSVSTSTRNPGPVALSLRQSRQVSSLAAALRLPPPRELRCRHAAHGVRSRVKRNALRPTNARSRVRPYTRSTHPPPRREARAPPLPTPRPRPHCRRAPALWLRARAMMLRSPPQPALSSSRFPKGHAPLESTPTMRRDLDSTRALSFRLNGFSKSQNPKAEKT